MNRTTKKMRVFYTLVKKDMKYSHLPRVEKESLFKKIMITLRRM